VVIGRLRVRRRRLPSSRGITIRLRDPIVSRVISSRAGIIRLRGRTIVRRDRIRSRGRVRRRLRTAAAAVAVAGMRVAEVVDTAAVVAAVTMAVS
jgi:hypothetical protein